MEPLFAPARTGGNKRSKLVAVFALFYILMMFILYRAMGRGDNGPVISSVEIDSTSPIVVVEEEVITQAPMAKADMLEDKPREHSDIEDACSKSNRNIDPNHTNAHLAFWRGLDGPTIQQYRADWESFIARIPTRPPQDVPMEGKGVVLTAGNKDTFERALTAIKILRHFACTLPIEVWHLPDEIPSNATLREIEAHNAISRDLSDERLSRPIRQRTNGEKQQTYIHNFLRFQIKAAAIINSRFQEVLYLDSDNIPTRDPSFLFEIDGYRQTGAVFWPDYWKTHNENKIFEILDISCADKWEQESGQIVVDKIRAWRPLQLAYYMQEHHDLYFQFLNGDKDTFNYAWKALDVPYHMTEVFLSMAGSIVEDGQFCGHTMLQYTGDDDKPLFVHANLMKITTRTHFLQEDGITERTWDYVKQYINNKRSTWFMPYFYVSPVTWRACMDFKSTEGELETIIEPFDDVLDEFQNLYFKLGGKGGSV